jgi:ribosome-associated translation inhibitor RaiA
MIISLSHKREEWREPVEKEAQKSASKIEKLLKHFDPDLVMLHGAIDKVPRKEEYAFSLNLSLPTGTLHATGEGKDIVGCIKAAFKEIEAQIKKHMAHVRKEFEWKGRGPKAESLA